MIYSQTYRRQATKLGILCLFVIIQAPFVFSATTTTPQTLAAMNKEVSPGSIVLLESGTYTTPIVPAASGTKENPIIYKPADGASPIFKNVSPAIFMKDKSHIKIEGVSFLDCAQFMSIESSSNITIENCDFENGKAWESCKLKFMGDYFHFKNNSVKNGTDLLTIQGGSFHLIEGNTFNKASHTCLVFMGVHNSVIRNNRLINPIQKLLEIFATRDREWSDPYRKSEHILIENNLFGPNGHGELYQDKEPPASWGTQFAGVKCILRNNIFAGCDGGMDFTGYGKIDGDGDSPEAVFNNTNRIYNNTIYSNGQKGRYGSGPGILLSHNDYTQFFDNLFMNNIIYANRIFQDAHTSKDVPSVQIAFRSPANPSDTRFYYNNIMAEGGEDEAVFWFKLEDKGYSVDTYEAEFPSYSGNNSQGNPLFVNENPDLTYLNRKDYVLQEGSPCIDAGGFLTHAIGEGEGKTIKVEDPYFFSDGFGMIGGDTIQLEGQSIRAIIVSVDYSTGLLTLDTPLSWSDGQGVSLKYSKTRPDMGVSEYGEPTSTLPTQGDLALPNSFNFGSYPNPFNSSTTVYYELPRVAMDHPTIKKIVRESGELIPPLDQ